MDSSRLPCSYHLSPDLARERVNDFEDGCVASVSNWNLSSALLLRIKALYKRMIVKGIPHIVCVFFK